MKHYIYETSPVDCFDGMMTLDEFVAKVAKESVEGTFTDLHSTLWNAMLCAAKVFQFCEFDGILRDKVYVFALPIPSCETLIGFVFKQDNNGTSFICSPIALPDYIEGELKAYH